MSESKPNSRFRIGHVSTPATPAARVRAVLENGDQLWDVASSELERLVVAPDTDAILAVMEAVREHADPHRVYFIHKLAASMLIAQASAQIAPEAGSGDFTWTAWYDLVPEVLVPYLSITPSEPELLNLLGLSYYELGETSLARRLFEAIKAIEPDHLQARTNIKACKERQQRTKGGVGSGQIPAELIRHAQGLRTEAKRIAEVAQRLEDKTISLCMIVKNEEEMLPGCLEAVYQHVDQLIVCDTGSTDRTMEIAREYGATVIEFPWNGSFSDARNASMKQATGDWLMYLDADEHIVDNDGALLRQLARKTWIEGFYLVETNFTGELEFGTQTSHMALRLYQNRPQYSFEGLIHEQKMRHMPTYVTERFQNSPIRVNHYGYLKDVIEDKSKRQRNLDLLHQQAEECEDSFTAFNLGSEYGAMHDWPEARKHFERALELARKDDEGVWQLAQFAPMMVSRLATAQRSTGAFDEALALISEGLRYWPQFTDLVYERALIEHEQGNLHDARESVETCIEMGDAPARLVAVQGKGSHQARVLLAGMMRLSGELEAAAEQLYTALEEAPQYLPTILELADTLLQKGSAEDTHAELQSRLGTRLNGANANLLLATAFYEAGHLGYARGYYDNVLQIQPDHPAALIGLAELELAELNFEAALETAHKVSPMDLLASRAARTEFLAAVIVGDVLRLARPLKVIAGADYLSVGERAFYAAWYARLTGGSAVLPADANAAAQLLLNLEALAKLERADEFEALVPMLAQAVPDQRERHLLLGSLYLRRQFIDMAGDEFLAVAQQFGPDPQTLTGLGKVATAKEMWQDAEVFLSESLKMDPDQADASTLLGLIQSRVGGGDGELHLAPDPTR